MRVSRLHIRNIMGHEDLEINDLGEFTMIEGLNGQGKSSVIEAIRSVVGGGHDATLLRNGSEEGEIVLVLDDETEIKKRITEKGSNTTVRRPGMGQISAAQTFIRGLIDNIDPTDMLAERDELRRTQFLLEALPLEIDREEVQAAIAGTVLTAASDFIGHPLSIVEKLHKRVFDERTGINRDAKAKKASIDQLSGSLSDDAGDDPTEEIRALEAEREVLPLKTKAEKARVEGTVTLAVSEIEAPFRERIEKLQERITQLTEEMGKRTQALTDERDLNLREIDTNERVRSAEIKARLEALRTGQQARAAAANTRKVVDGFKTEHTDLVGKSQQLTQALARLDALKLGLLQKIPIKGITIVDGVIHQNGVPWPRINTGEQVKIAINLAKLRAKDLPLVPIDNIECLDGPTLEAFRKNAPKSGLQFIITKVRQDPNDRTPGLTITTDEPAEAEAVPA